MPLTDTWDCGRVTISADAWTQLGTGQRRSMMIHNLPDNKSRIILAPNLNDFSNDRSNATCGIEVEPGAKQQLEFEVKTPVFARVESGGQLCLISYSEGA